MRLSLLRSLLIALFLVALFGVALEACSRSSAAAVDTNDCSQTAAEAPSDMPWESLARQLMGSVSL